MKKTFKFAVLVAVILLTGAGCTSPNNSDEISASVSEEVKNINSTLVDDNNGVDSATQRDIQRRNDIELVYDALTDWYNDQVKNANGTKVSYPNVNYEALATMLDPKYIDEFPYDPIRPGNYSYIVSEDGNGFALGVWFETSDTPWTQSRTQGYNSDEINNLLETEMGSIPTW